MEKQKCLGCKKVIAYKPGDRKRKFCTYECYAVKSAKSWGMSTLAAKGAAMVREHRMKALAGAVH